MGELRSERPAGVDIGIDQRANLVTVVAGNDNVANVGRKMQDHPRLQRTDADPGSGGELEVLRQPAIEQQALLGLGRVDEGDRVAHPVPAFRVEGRARRLGVAPIAGRDIGAADHGLELPAGRNQPEVLTRHRQADGSRPAAFPIGADGERCSLGRPKPGDHQDALAACRDRHLVERIPEMLREPGRGVEHHRQPAEEGAAELGLAPQMGDQGLIALRHVEIDRRRNVAEVPYRLGGAIGRRLAVVDIERAAIVEHQAHIVVAAEGVVPGQPIDDHRRRFRHEGKGLEQHLLVAAQHPMGVDHPLGHAGRARGEEEFRDMVGLDCRMGVVYRSCRLHFQQRLEQGRLPRCRRTPRDHQLRVTWHRGGDGPSEGLPVGGEHQPRRQQVEHGAKLAMVARQQRIGWRDRRVGDPDIEGGEPEQGVLQIIAGENGDRPLR